MPTSWLPILSTWQPAASCPSPQRPCPLLRLPLELRSQILAYTLPYTIPSTKNPDKPHVWHRASIATLLLNRQIYAEATRILYGCNVFVLHVKWDGITFAYNWHLVSGLTPGTTLQFPGIELSERNIRLMRRFYVRVKIEHEYTGGIKYGFEGLGLADGVRRQIRRLTDILHSLENVEWLCLKLERPGYATIRMNDHKAESDSEQAVLGSLEELRNTRIVKVEGDVNPKFATAFERHLNGRKSRNKERGGALSEHDRRSVSDRQEIFT